MRKCIYFLLSLIFLSFHSQDLQKNISGEWEIEKIEGINMQVEPFNKTDTLNKPGNLPLSRSYIFTKDGALIINSNNHETLYGDYTIKNDSLIFNYIWEDDKVSENYKISKYKSKNMVLEQSFKDVGTIQTFFYKVR